MSRADDVEAVRALIHEYAYRLDAGDLDGVAALFEHASLGSLDDPGRVHGTAGARTLYDPVILYDDGTPSTRHVISNVTVTLEDGTTARARSYFTVLQAAPGLPLQPIIAGDYHDRFEKVDGEWRFAERLFGVGPTGDLSRHMRGAPPPARDDGGRHG